MLPSSMRFSRLGGCVKQRHHHDGRGEVVEQGHQKAMTASSHMMRSGARADLVGDEAERPVGVDDLHEGHGDEEEDDLAHLER